MFPIHVQDAFDEVVLAVVHQLVCLRCILKRHVVGDDEGRIELAVLDVPQQLLPVPKDLTRINAQMLHVVKSSAVWCRVRVVDVVEKMQLEDLR